MSEAAVISARKAKLQQQANMGDARARAALALADNPNRFLSTVQVGITLIGILAGAFGEATLADDLETLLERVPWLAPYSRAISLVIMVVVLTYLSLIIGELVPKRLALRNPEAIAGLVAAPMNFLSAVVSPAVSVLSVSTDTILRLLGVKPSTEPPVTEEEIRVLIQQGTQAGVFEVAEQDMVEAVFRLNDQRAFDLMTPRPEIIWLDLKDSSQEMVAKVTESGYSRFPVCQGSLDNVVGVVRAKDLLARSLAGQPLDLRAAMRSPIFVPESVLAFRCWSYSGAASPIWPWSLMNTAARRGHQITLPHTIFWRRSSVRSRGERSRKRFSARMAAMAAGWGAGSGGIQEILSLRSCRKKEHDYYQALGGFCHGAAGARVPTAERPFHWAGLRFEVMDIGR